MPERAAESPDRQAYIHRAGWRVTFYRAGLRLAGWGHGFARIIEGLVEGFSLGLMRPDDVDSLVLESYSRSPEFYDPENYQPPFAEDESAIARELCRLTPGRRLLDAFCGQGREARTFAELGFEVTGIDRLSAMVDRATSYAAEQGFEARFVATEFERYEPNELFDIVYTSVWMYSTVQSRTRRLRFLQKCRDLCTPNGLIVISYKVRTSSQRFQFIVRHAIARVFALVTFGNRRTELGDRIYYNLFWHHFSDDEISDELQDAGLVSISRTESRDNGELVFQILCTR